MFKTQIASVETGQCKVDFEGHRFGSPQRTGGQNRHPSLPARCGGWPHGTSWAQRASVEPHGHCWWTLVADELFKKPVDDIVIVNEQMLSVLGGEQSPREPK